MAYGDSAYQRAQAAGEDIIGMDKLAKAFLRQLARMPSGSIVGVLGGPGSGKTEFVRRVAWLVREQRDHLGLDDVDSLYAGYVWFNPWSYVKQGHFISGLVAHIARSGFDTKAQLDRARELVGQINRMSFDGTMGSGGGAALNTTDIDPLERVHGGFRDLVEAATGGDGGRLLVFIEDLDHLVPPLRWSFLDALRLLSRSDAKIIVVAALGRESALEAVRSHEGSHLTDQSATLRLEEILDLTLTVPNLEVRKIGSLLRTYIGDGEDRLKRAFGAESIVRLSAATAHRPLGAPRFLQRLAHRVTLLAEYAVEAGTRELSESQWAWVVVSERWPDFRRFMIRGGRERWIDLRNAVARLGKPSDPAASGVRPEMAQWLDRDLILADYLRLHADGFDRDAEGIFWLENLLLAAGL